MAYRVFLSSTSKDLATYREAVHRGIDGLDGFELIRMESFGARDADARGIDERKLGEADLLVGLMGHCYGSSPPDDPTSFTEQEYDLAVQRELPRLMFVAPDNFPVPFDLIEPDEKRARQQAFRVRVMVDRVVASFTTPEELARSVNTALANWRAEREKVDQIAAELVAAKARAAEMERALEEGQKEREALRAAVQALADKAKQPDAPVQARTGSRPVARGPDRRGRGDFCRDRRAQGGGGPAQAGRGSCGPKGRGRGSEASRRTGLSR